MDSICQENNGLASIEDRVNISIRRLKDFIKKSKERLIVATRNDTHNTRINRTTITRKQKIDIGLHVNAHKTEHMCYNQTGDISTLDGTSVKLEDKFTYLGSSVSSTEKRHRHTANEGMDSYR